MTNKSITGLTVTMENCTVTYTTNEANVVKILDGQVLFLHFRKRGNITAVSANPYSSFNISGLDLSGYAVVNTMVYLREASKDHFVYPVGNGIVAYGNNQWSIQIQQEGGTSVNRWKVGNSFYLDVCVIFIKP